MVERPWVLTWDTTVLELTKFYPANAVHVQATCTLHVDLVSDSL